MKQKEVLKTIADYYEGMFPEHDFLSDLIKEKYPQINIDMLGYEPDQYLSSLLRYIAKDDCNTKLDTV